MVRIRRTRHGVKRRLVVRKRRGAKRKLTVPRKVVSVVANKRFLKLPYSSGLISQTPTTSPAVQQFRCNSIYDPDYTNSGTANTTVQGYNSWKDFFLHYKVKGVAVDVTGVVNTSTAIIRFVLWPHSSVSYPGDLDSLVAQKDSIARTYSAQKGVFHLKKYFSCAKIFAESRASYDAERDYGALFDAHPDKVGYISCFFQNFDEATSVNVTYRVKLTYYVELSQPRIMTQGTS